ncbi:DNA/RNA nuclease SfsA [Maridesulfovibrio salexigens]|uniref:Sugar fermentation stimulation protein homolog n=1 Tax=Maridesulfovibrio salexigens (strain ATCC 14822 / DSM 2638 / NCIMB 8403 / VKM B-1763) TaxID=526222 RepID=SFSA_MARSD|nr:DNA/RNA nuclease SfsA [Maridesulfovibrio salexigens]C6BVP4.1 RecName: Full=Sugar fermentation stimulation protein homolog [Maridesulfovibrio salexigens DSM 2638]ACS78258.1 sugar fermentation stimulation protein [Maridesulfovibrio salexigens DSM 2638]
MSEPLIFYPQGCCRAIFIRRYKRFTVEAMLDGEVVGVHTNNTGSMLGLLREGQEIYISPAQNPNRKLKWTLEAVMPFGEMIGVNTSVPNKMLQLAFEAGQLPEAGGYTAIKREAKVGNSRLDGLFTDDSGKLPKLWVECKNVTLVEDDIACFPDAQTERGRKHLVELMDLAAKGDRVALFFFVQRTDGSCFGPADFIDPEYAELFYKALDAGVKCWAYEAVLSERGIGIGRKLPLAACR